MPKALSYPSTVLLKTIQFCISTVFVYTQLNVKTVIFQQFSLTQIRSVKIKNSFKLFSLVNKVKWFQVFLCIRTNSIKHRSLIYTQLNDQTVLFQTIQISIITQFSSIRPIDRTQSNAITPCQSGSGSDGNKWILRILQSSSIPEFSPSIVLCHIQDTQLVSPNPLQRSSRCILQPQPTGTDMIDPITIDFLEKDTAGSSVSYYQLLR